MRGSKFYLAGVEPSLRNIRYRALEDMYFK
jgi:hypothetical protein